MHKQKNRSKRWQTNENYQWKAQICNTLNGNRASFHQLRRTQFQATCKWSRFRLRKQDSGPDLASRHRDHVVSDHCCNGSYTAQNYRLNPNSLWRIAECHQLIQCFTTGWYASSFRQSSTINTAQPREMQNEQFITWPWHSFEPGKCDHGYSIDFRSYFAPSEQIVAAFEFQFIFCQLGTLKVIHKWIGRRAHERNHLGPVVRKE